MENVEELIESLKSDAASEGGLTSWGQSIQEGLLALLEDKLPKPRVKVEGIFRQGDPVWVWDKKGEKPNKAIFIYGNNELNHHFGVHVLNDDTLTAWNFCKHRKVEEEKSTFEKKFINPGKIGVAVIKKLMNPEPLIDGLTQEEFFDKTNKNFDMHCKKAFDALVAMDVTDMMASYPERYNDTK